MPDLTVLLAPEPPHADVVVIVDVLRFTSSAAYALAHGALGIVPCATVDEARAARRAHPSALLAGERDAVKPDGFDLGNSPLEFTRAAVQGKDIIWTTTNGTQAVALAVALAVAPALARAAGQASAPPPSPSPSQALPLPLPSAHTTRDLLLASYVNLSAVVTALERVLQAGASIAVVCSGREGGFALEDAACAGRLVRALQVTVSGALTMNDGARASACLDEAYGEDFARLFRDAQHGRTLRDLGLGADLDACAARDAVQVVPRWRAGRFVAR